MRTKVAVIALLASACGDVATIPVASVASSIAFSCMDEGDPEPGCPVLWTFQDGDDEMATDAGIAVGTEPLWLGQLIESVEAPRACPNWIPLAHNKVYVPAFYETAVFQVSGLTKVANLGVSVGGHPMAAYSVPSGPLYSSFPRDKYIMQGGLMKARCNTFEGRTPTGRIVYVGTVTWYDYTGEVYLSDRTATPGGDGGRGWGYRDTASGTTSGAGSLPGGAQTAVSRYLSGNGCTEGWEIWVDGARACDAHGNEYSI